QDRVEQPSGEMTANKGDPVTLHCNYSTSATNVYIYWYKQLPNRSPTFMLSVFSFGKGTTVDEFKDRFFPTLNSKSTTVQLMIKNLHVSDSAVYYCALQPTVT
uniref:Ig-like domain-containing protein n=1 Tax=Cyprinus carpio carpio TaxID=630221 RepID=A0A8C1DDT5_CYPCA